MIFRMGMGPVNGSKNKTGKPLTTISRTHMPIGTMGIFVEIQVMHDKFISDEYHLN